MNPLIIAAIAQGIGGLIEIWRLHANKPEGWTPTAQDWDDMLLLNDKTAEDYKAEARARLGILPPVPE